MTKPPNDLPVYRMLTGPDDAAFCRRVSEALALGYQLYGSPAATFDGHSVILAQAIGDPVSPNDSCVPQGLIPGISFKAVGDAAA